MSYPIQKLAVVPRLFPEIVNGEKTCTIRWREARIVPGPLRFFNEAVPEQTVEVTVTRCTDVPLSDAAAFVGRAEDWPAPILLDGMREHYPQIELTSGVQVVEFEVPD